MSAKKPKPKLPAFVAPQLAILEDRPPDGPGWIHEIKYDGYRALAAVTPDKVKLYTRSGLDWTEKFSSLVPAFLKLRTTALIDGEVIVQDDQGLSRFGLLQQALSDGDTSVLRYVAFDLLSLDGEDLRARPLIERKAILKKLLKKARTPLLYGDHLSGDGNAAYGEACRLKIEGLVSKRKDGRYISRRDPSWIKSKCLGRSEFIIGGYRPSDKPGRPFASLLLGEYTPKGLIYRGRVGTGFDMHLLADLGPKLKSRERTISPFREVPRDIRAKAHWVEPDLVAEITYTELTGDGHLRHPAFIGLREDKKASEVTGADRGAHSRSGSPYMSPAADQVAGVKLTHPDRVLYPDGGPNKLALAKYLEAAAKRILPFVARHPLSLVRCPDGIARQCFFQKHHTDSMPEGFREVMITEKGGDRAAYLYIEDVAGLVGAAQISALELHVWGSTIDDLEHPDRLIFDLDPAPDLGFAEIRDAARDIRDILAAAKLPSFPLLTGGKGIHVIAPLSRKNDWAEVKSFAEAIARSLERDEPDRFVASASKAKRKGRIFVDWLRNERGATAIAPYSPRARKGAAVAMPVSWAELGKVKAANAYDTKTALRRIAGLKSDPWKGYSKGASISKQTLAAAVHA